GRERSSGHDVPSEDLASQLVGDSAMQWKSHRVLDHTSPLAATYLYRQDSPSLSRIHTAPEPTARECCHSLARSFDPSGKGIHMNKTRMTVTALVAFGFVALVAFASASTTHAGATRKQASNVCPGGKVRFGVEPYDTGAKFLGAYQTLTSLLQKKLHCSVKLYVATSYTAEVEAMRAKKLDVGEFGPLGYIFAKKLAKAQPVAVFATKDRKPVVYYAALWVPSGSSITSVKGLVGKTLALSDPASTSGNLFPLYALKKAGVSQDSVKIQYAGSHSA